MMRAGGNDAPLLLADVGATSTRFALTTDAGTTDAGATDTGATDAGTTDAGRTLTGERVLASADFSGLVEAVRCYYGEAGITADTPQVVEASSADEQATGMTMRDRQANGQSTT